MCDAPAVTCFSQPVKKNDDAIFLESRVDVMMAWEDIQPIDNQIK